MASEKELRENLRIAHDHMNSAMAAIASEGDIARWNVAYQDLLLAERELAKFLSEPHAVRFDFPVQWDIGAPMPILLNNDGEVVLMFLLGDAVPGTGETVACVKFENCVSTMMGTPNDEVYHGHPLYGRGFEGYKPLLVKNSQWIRELMEINSVHRDFKPDRWSGRKHYIFGFHDCTFECVASSYSLTLSNRPIWEVAAHELQKTYS